MRPSKESSDSSTEDSKSESGIGTKTTPAPGGNHDNIGGQGRRGEEGERTGESRPVSGSQSDESSGSPVMSSRFSQSLSHSAPYLSSDESESEDKDMWEELQKLRQR